MSIFKLFKREEPPVPKPIEPTERFYDEHNGMGYFEHPCPKCSARVYYDFTCHTYGGNPDGTGWKACLPCDSAAYLTCSNDNCDWSYTWGHNPKNPRFANEEQDRPDWLVGDWPY